MVFVIAKITIKSLSLFSIQLAMDHWYCMGNYVRYKEYTVVYSK